MTAPHLYDFSKSKGGRHTDRTKHSERTKHSDRTRHTDHTKGRDERDVWVKNLPPVIGTAYWR